MMDTLAQKQGTTERNQQRIPLVVDLDGTLVRTDLLLESVFLLAKKNPLLLLKLPLWLVRGRAYLKQRIAMEVVPDAQTLPYNRGLLDYLEEEKRQGRTLVLATGSDERVARSVAREVGLFDDVFASDGRTNLSGECKRERLVAAFGTRGFDYAGNSWRDLPIWGASRVAILVGVSRKLLRIVSKPSQIGCVIEDRASRFSVFFHALRPHHLVKNILVFVPLAAAHRLYEFGLLVQALLAFVAFSLCASSIYLFNDLIDLPADRHHPAKKERALASGQFPIGWAIAAIPLLLAGAMAVGLLLSPLFIAVLGFYWGLMAAYCLRLKELFLVDTLILGCAYALRVVAGGVAVGIMASPWLTGVIFLLFSGLALLKRYADIVATRPREGAPGRGRRYDVGHMDLIAVLGGAVACVAVLLLTIHIGETQRIYAYHQVQWVFCVVLVCSIAHLWLMAHRGRIRGDPVAFALKDRLSQVFGLVMLAALAVAT